jgi:F0F1-type ATP synthase delta subunit
MLNTFSETTKLTSWNFSTELISETIRDRENLQTLYSKFSKPSIQRKTVLQNLMQNKNSVYLQDM